MSLEITETGKELPLDDEGINESGPDRLYRLWEENQWSAKHLDFTQDIVDWRTRLTPAQRQAFLWMAAQFLDGEEAVNVTLAPFMEPLQSHEDRIFLSTQIVDEARHHVFFDRFMREVVGLGSDYGSTLAAVQHDLTFGYREVFAELDRMANRLRRFPHDLPLLAQGITLYHILIEAMLAHSGQHFLREFCVKQAVLPGFTKGILAVTRDESRHIAFGVSVLRNLIADRKQNRQAAIEMLNRILPHSAGGFIPPELDWAFFEPLGVTGRDLFTFAIRSLMAKLQRAGIQPGEVLQLVKLGDLTAPSAMVDRLFVLIEGGAIGGAVEPRPTEATMDALFAAARDTAIFTHVEVHGVVQWIFDDHQPRYLELHAVAEPLVAVGMHPAPRLTLRCTGEDWVRIATGRTSQQAAMLARKLKISGDWGFALRLPRVLPI